MSLSEVVKAAKAAKAAWSTRFCMGAAWRGPTDRQIGTISEMFREVKSLYPETCATLGLLKDENQAKALKDAGLDFYNHNIDTSSEYYKEIITTKTFEDRIKTLEHMRNANLKVCCGGILGMGETNEDRINMILTLPILPSPPESIPINKLIRIPGTPLENSADVDPADFIVRTRIMMPSSYIRLSAGREIMSPEMQLLCFRVGANSIFYRHRLIRSIQYH